MMASTQFKRSGTGLTAPCSFLFLSFTLFAADSPPLQSIEAFGYKWQVQTASDWKFENGILNLTVPRPATQPRRPAQYALAETPDLLKVTIEAEVQAEPESLRKRHNSLIFVYAWKDKDHFNYRPPVDTAKLPSTMESFMFTAAIACA